MRLDDRQTIIKLFKSALYHLPVEKATFESLLEESNKVDIVAEIYFRSVIVFRVIAQKFQYCIVYDFTLKSKITNSFMMDYLFCIEKPWFKYYAYDVYADYYMMIIE